MREIVTDWTSPSGGGQTVLNFADAVPVNAQREALHLFWTTLAERQGNGWDWNIRQEGREVNPATGLSTGLWTDAESFPGSGVLATAVVADATQVLIRWRTNDSIGARRIQGRTFYPGLGVAGLNAGNLDPAYVSYFAAAANALISADVGLGVYSRPTDARPGSFNEAVSASVWPELAVQRRRRT